MAFERLDIIVERLVGRIVDTGELGVDAPAQPRKNADPEGPASATGLRQAGGREPGGASHERMNVTLRLISSRCEPTHSPTRSPTRRVGSHLVLAVDNLHHATPF